MSRTQKDRWWVRPVGALAVVGVLLILGAGAPGWALVDQVAAQTVPPPTPTRRALTPTASPTPTTAPTQTTQPGGPGTSDSTTDTASGAPLVQSTALPALSAEPAALPTLITVAAPPTLAPLAPGAAPALAGVDAAAEQVSVVVALAPAAADRAARQVTVAGPAAVLLEAAGGAQGDSIQLEVRQSEGLAASARAPGAAAPTAVPPPQVGLRLLGPVVEINLLRNGAVVAAPRFREPLQVCFTYTRADLVQAGGEPRNLLVHTYDEDLARWAELPTGLAPDGTARVCGFASHFSLFGVATTALPLVPRTLPNTGAAGVGGAASGLAALLVAMLAAGLGLRRAGRSGAAAALPGAAKR